MNYLFLILVITTQEIPTTSIREMLGWVVGVLFVFSSALLVIIKNDHKERRDSDAERIKELTRLYEAELAYNKAQDIANTKMITDTSNVLTQSVKHLDNNVILLNDVKSLLDQNKERLITIANHLENGKRSN